MLICIILDLQNDGDNAKNSIGILQRGLLINIYISFIECYRTCFRMKTRSDTEAKCNSEMFSYLCA